MLSCTYYEWRPLVCRIHRSAQGLSWIDVYLGFARCGHLYNPLLAPPEILFASILAHIETCRFVIRRLSEHPCAMEFVALHPGPRWRPTEMCLSNCSYSFMFAIPLGMPICLARPQTISNVCQSTWNRQASPCIVPYPSAWQVPSQGLLPNLRRRSHNLSCPQRDLHISIALANVEVYRRWGYSTLYKSPRVWWAFFVSWDLGVDL